MLKWFISAIPTLQKIHRGILHIEGKEKQSQIPEARNNKTQKGI
jgi:hypothetical protein